MKKELLLLKLEGKLDKCNTLKDCKKFISYINKKTNKILSENTVNGSFSINSINKEQKEIFDILYKYKIKAYKKYIDL